MKLDRQESKKNKTALKLTSILLSMILVGNGLALTGCSINDQDKETVTMVRTNLPTEEPTTNCLKEYWPEYEEKVYNLKEKLGLPECFVNDYDILSDIIKILKEQEQYDKSIEYIKDNRIIYTSDKKICYDIYEKKLQLSLNLFNENVLREYWTFDQEKYEKGFDSKNIITTIVYDSNGNNLEFNRVSTIGHGLSHSYDNMPIYTFEKEEIYRRDELFTRKEFTHYIYNTDNDFYGSYEYTALHYYGKSSKFDTNLRLYFLTDLGSESEEYNNDEIFNEEFNAAFDNRKIDVLDKCIYNFYNAKTGSNEKALKK